MLLLCSTLFVAAQFSDDFSDGDFTSNPRWTGDIDNFIVNAEKELQLMAPEAGTSVLWAEVDFPDSIRWSFDFKMDFAPSSSNRLRIFLITDASDPGNSGYAISIGENGGDDPLRLYRIDDNKESLLASGPGLFGSDPSEATIVIERTITGQWTAQAIIGSVATLLFDVKDVAMTPVLSGRFGLQCTYTKTRKELFFFDNITIQAPVPDTSPPVFESVTVIDDDELRLQFDEAIDIAALQTGDIIIDQGIGNPVGIFPASADPSAICILLTNELQDGTTYHIDITNVQDTAGNRSALQSITFEYVKIFPAAPYQVLVNEIMADPSPPVALPNAEYLEVFNRSDKTIDLASIVLRIGSSETALPATSFLPGQYLILTDADDAVQFETYGIVVPVPSFPTLTNSGTDVSLLSPTGDVLHHISYTAAWYRDPARDDGGWSLELINPNAPCALSSNWRVAQTLTGGTPGAVNSVIDSSQTDTDGPRVESLFPDPAGYAIIISFNEVLGSDDPIFALSPYSGEISVIPDGYSATLLFTPPLTEATEYTLQIVNVADCTGNTSVNQELTFGLPSNPVTGDLLINELLFDPHTGGSRYLELHNTSTKFLNAADLIVFEQYADRVTVRSVTNDFLIKPQSYVVFTEEPTDVISRYPAHNQSVIIPTDLPAFDRKAATVGIIDAFGTILDTFGYDEDLHNPLLVNTKGVALERLSLSSPTNDRGNWQSAAASAGFGTPGLPNSQTIPDGSDADIFEIVNSTFSPDGDGFEDLLVVRFPAPAPGTLVNIRVFDATGREIKKVWRNAAVGAGSLAQWDGTTLEGLRAPVGIYILLIETFDAQGNVRTYKEPVVLAARL